MFAQQKLLEHISGHMAYCYPIMYQTRSLIAFLLQNCCNWKNHLVMFADVCFQSRYITNSISPYADPVILVTRKNNPKSWSCVDSRRLNAATKIHAYPFPVIEKYWCQWMNVARKNSPFILFQFQVMPFGLKKSPLPQRLMEVVLGHLHGKIYGLFGWYNRPWSSLW